MNAWFPPENADNCLAETYLIIRKEGIYIQEKEMPHIYLWGT